MAGRKKSQEAGSLDSLLDTMTNVVGILVMVLVMTQLSVSEGIDRIIKESGPSITEQEVAKKRKEAEELRKLLEEIQNTDPAELKNQQVNLQEIDTLAATLKKQIEELPKVDIDIVKIRKIVDEQKKKSLALETKMRENNLEIAKIRAQLEDTPIKKAPPPTVINLPNPRPAPKGLKQELFMCRGGRIYYMDYDAHKKKAQLAANIAVKRVHPGKAPPAILCDKVVEAFNKRFVGDRDFQYQLRVANYTLYVNVNRRHKEVGETTEKIAGRASIFAARIRKFDPKKQWVRFLVWPDSFDTYIEARKKTDARDLPAGWAPQTTSAEYSFHLGMNATCKDHVRPKPKPRDPNLPPPPKRPPPPPNDDID